jgi:plasmid maintenance system antidote protein VapI
MAEKRMAPVHPGEMLQTLFMEPLQISQNALATSFTLSALSFHL